MEASPTRQEEQSGDFVLEEMDNEIRAGLEHQALVFKAEQKMEEVAGPAEDRINVT